jgi:hypothetical protein
MIFAAENTEGKSNEKTLVENHLNYFGNRSQFLTD